MKLLFIILISLLHFHVYSQPKPESIDKVLYELNQLRSQGCRCGKDYMAPAGPLVWNHTLYEVSRDYARLLFEHNWFSHISPTGKTLADRLDAIGYDWQRIGENLGRGYDDFYAVFKAWLDSPSHCKMLMDPEVTHIGMSKYHDYWVQSFSLPMQTTSY